FEGVRNRHPALLNGRTKCPARWHQGHVHLRRALIQLPSEGTCLCPQRDAEVFALESILAQRAPLPLEKFGIIVNSVCRRFQPDPGWSIAIPEHPKWIGTAPSGGQHGKARLWPARAHRTQGRNQIGGEPCRLIRHNPSIHGQPAYGIITAWERQYARAVR